jgi:predicted O-methyltransferase YrrM
MGESRMDPAAVDAYLNGLLVGEDDALRAAAGGGLPPHEVAPNQGKLLLVLALAIGAQRILEIGTLGGYSTLWLARSGAHVTTLENDPHHAKAARRALAGHAVELIEGDALASLATLEGPFDLVFIDADKQRHADYLDAALRLSRPGTLIVADNVVRGGAVADPDDPDPRVQGVRRFFERLAAEPRLTGTAIQTVGAKGHDGFAIAVVSRGP